jgi:hypothetical protein
VNSVVRRAPGFDGARFAEGERFRPVRIQALCADGDTVIVRWDGHGVANDGSRTTTAMRGS